MSTKMNKSKSKAEFLWMKWRGRFDDAKVALAAGIYIGNRWVKRQTYKDDFYQLKDQWIEGNQSFLVNGAKTREDMGKGTLYVHWFDVCGFSFSLHSYRSPKFLLNGWAENKVQFGSSLSDDEIKHLKNRGFDFSSFISAIRFGIKNSHVGTANRRLKARELEGFIPPEQHSIQVKPPAAELKSMFSIGDVVIFSPSFPHPHQGEEGVVLKALNAAWVQVRLTSGYETTQSDRTLRLVQRIS
jgi:hypothetical protein